MVVGPDQQPLHWNRAFPLLLGMRERDLRRKPPVGFCHEILALETCRQPESCLARRAIANRKSVRMDEVRGADREFIVTAVPLLDESGAPFAVIETFRDVSAESRMQARYKELLEAERKRSAELQTELDEARSQLLRVFRDEAAGICERLATEVTALRAAEPETVDALLQRAMREAHTLKGSAAMVGLDEIASLANLCETALVQRQRGTRRKDAVADDVLLGAVDAIVDYLDSSESEGPVRSVLEVSRKRLEDYLGGRTPSPAGASPRRALRREPMMRVPQTQVEALQANLEKLFSARNLGLSLDQLDPLLQDTRLRVRALTTAPLSTLFEPFRRALEERARSDEREIDVTIDGADLVIDRRLVEDLRGPFTHLVNNAFDHGIGAVEKRVAGGKPPTAKIDLRAKESDGMIELSIVDDGFGIDVARVREVALAQKLVGEQEASRLTDEQTIELIWRPGFSTARALTQTSGRGVGLDAVRAQAQELGGDASVTSIPGKGTTFRLRIPRTRS